jgi:predicted Zn-dependent protease
MDMRVRFLVMNGLVLGGIAWMTTFAGMEVRAAEVLPHRAGPASTALTELEGQAARTPANAPSVAALATAYLDRDQPGLATAVIEKAPRQVRERPEVAVLYARALFHRGHTREALAVARDAGDLCADSPSCPTWLVAKTARQVAFLEQVVAAGIDDPLDDPGATRAAYERSAREVRLVAMR